MKKTFFQASALFVFAFNACVLRAASIDSGHAGGASPPCRIVSLAPSVTEILFELGLGGRVAGVTRYCRFPPEALAKPQVGGYVDPNYEALLRLRPDIVIVLTAHTAAREHLRSLGLRTLTVDHTTMGGIIGSVAAIGTACGVAPEAGAMARKMAARIDRVKNTTAPCGRPRVLMSVDRTTDAASSVYVAGNNTCYDEMIAMAGGVNAYTGAAAYPAVSAEGILRMNPQVIIDLVPALDGGKHRREKALAQWNALTGTEAVARGRVYIFEQDYAVIPGPRFVLLLEDMARAIHPERYVK
jgi:iron complex transport system substrate-binding protein